MELLDYTAVAPGASSSDSILPRQSPLVGFLRHSPAQAGKLVGYRHFDQLRQWRSHQDMPTANDIDVGTARLKTQALKLPMKSPYVGSHRHAPPSPVLAFSRFALPPSLLHFDGSDEKESPAASPLMPSSGRPPFEASFFGSECEEVFATEGFAGLTEGTSSRPASAEVLGRLPETAWCLIFSLVADLPRIACLSRVARGFSSLLQSELVWANRAVHIPPAVIEGLAPVLGTWLPAWRLAAKLIIPRSAQLIEELTLQTPHLPIELAWRFDSELKGDGVRVVNHGRSVQRLDGAEEELVVIGDAPLTKTVGSSVAPYLEVTLDDRSTVVHDMLNDFGIGVTQRPPSNVGELGTVADEVPLSWVVDFTQFSVVLSINNKEAAKGVNARGDDLKEGDRVGLRVTPAGSFEIFINGTLREHLTPPADEGVPRGVELYPVLDLYGCTAQISRTDAETPEPL